MKLTERRFSKISFRADFQGQATSFCRNCNREQLIINKVKIQAKLHMIPVY